MSHDVCFVFLLDVQFLLSGLQRAFELVEMSSQFCLLSSLLPLEVLDLEEVALQVFYFLLLIVVDVPELFSCVFHLFQHVSEFTQRHLSLGE